MNEVVANLLILQERDARVAGLEFDLENLPQQQRRLDAEQATRAAKFEQLKAETRQIEVERKKLDLEVESKRAAIARYKGQQMQTRRNEEFAALHHQIETTGREIGDLEDQELEKMEAYDRGQAELARAQKELALSQEKTAQKRLEVEKRIAGVKAQLEEALAQQARAVAALEPEVVTRYRRILASKGDAAVVRLSTGTCGGCHMRLTHQTVISVQKAAGLVACENCGRLLYAD